MRLRASKYLLAVCALLLAASSNQHKATKRAYVDDGKLVMQTMAVHVMLLRSKESLKLQFPYY